MKKLLHSFYARLSLIFLALMTILGAGIMVTAFNFAGHLFDEVEQLLNLGYARSIAQEIQPLVAEGFAEDRIKDAIHYMMVLNPRVEIYLLDSTGKILAYFTHPEEKIIRDSVDLKPVYQFLENGKNRLILGEDPRSTQRVKPFSAAPLRMGTETGFVYIILGGQQFDQSYAAIQSSYYLRTMVMTGLLVFLTTLAAGFFLFFFLTRRLRTLSNAVNTFKQGELFHRVKVKGRDEISTLGRRFNEMAATIEANVEKLKSSERLRRELVENISHDLRSPLTSIRGYLETIILKDEEFVPARRREYLEIILRNVSGFQRLVEELFDLVMLETKQVSPDYEPFQMMDLAQDVVLKLKPQAEKADVSLTLDFPPSLPLLYGDIGLMERALTNLIENALHFTPPGGTVHLSFSCKDKGGELSVTDTGKGIPPEEIPYIFERYYHTKKNKEQSLGRTGLGLAIAREIVELHNSQLHVESTLGKGTRFYFYLPSQCTT
jgi:signal transduction histidine kinase